MYAASSDNRNATAAAMSSGCPKRLSGMVDSFSARSLSGSAAAANSARSIGVSVVPGETLFTRMPCGASSAANARVIASTPPLVAV
jgi:hypothetical protein